MVGALDRRSHLGGQEAGRLEQDGASLANESADLIYHWLAVLAGARISLDEVAAALEAREGRSGLEEKASRRG